MVHTAKFNVITRFHGFEGINIFVSNINEIHVSARPLPAYRKYTSRRHSTGVFYLHFGAKMR
jgi:hypothetical protein